MKKSYKNKIMIMGIILLLLCIDFVSANQQIISKDNQKDIRPKIKIDDVKDTVSISLSIFGKTQLNKESTNISLDDANKILMRFKELKNSITCQPYEERTQQLKQEFILLLAQHNLIPSAVSLHQYQNILNPPWLDILQKNHKEYSSNFLNKPADVGAAAALFCSIGGEGVGFLFPFIMLPRPRFFTTWAAIEGNTMVGKLFSIGGFVAVGSQFGVALGFWGIGLAFAFPYGNIYGFVGYSLFASATAQYIERYPPDYPPVIVGTSPSDGALNIPISLKELSFSIEDSSGDLMSYSVTTNPNIGSGSGSLKTAGTYSVQIDGLIDLTEYSWTIKVSDDVQTTEQTYTFTTEAVAPIVLNPLPKDNAQYVSIDTSSLSFDLKDYQGDLMSWTVETKPNIGSGGMNDVDDGRYSITISGLDYFTTYTWFVNVTDGIHWMKRIYIFRTVGEGIQVFEPSDDSYVGAPYENNGYSPSLHLRNGSSGDNYLAAPALKFDFSSIPTDSTILSASLQLFYFDNADHDPAGRILTMRRFEGNWNEETLMRSNMPPYSNQISAITSTPNSPGVWVSWDITSDIQMFYSGAIENYGWIIRDEQFWGGSGIPLLYFHSKEYGTDIPIIIIEIDAP